MTTTGATDRAFCPWCRHHRDVPDTSPHDRCSGVFEVRPYGVQVYDLACRDHNPTGDCSEYQPSLATRLVRLVGRRRPGSAVRP